MFVNKFFGFLHKKTIVLENGIEKIDKIYYNV